MGTRSLTILYDNEHKEIAVLYRQYDGYPDGHGKELAEYLAGAKYNDYHCLAANIVRHFKDTAADGEKGGYAYNIYLYPAGTRDMGEDYIYKVYPGIGGIEMEIECPYQKRTLWKGKPANFDAEYLAKEKGEL